jgi:hypothetical protein
MAVKAFITGKAGGYRSETPFRCYTLGDAPALPVDIKLGWKRWSKKVTLDYCAHLKNCSCKKFYKIDTRWQYYKLFFFVTDDET